MFANNHEKLGHLKRMLKVKLNEIKDMKKEIKYIETQIN